MGREGKLGLYTAESLLLFPPLFDRFLSFFFRLVVHLILLLPRNLEPSLGVSLPPSLSLSLLLSSLNPEERCVIRRVPPPLKERVNTC